MPSRSLDALTPAMRALADRFLKTCHELNLDVLIYCTLRTREEQDELYKIGREPGDTRKVVTNARGGQSAHNYGLAFDGVPLVGGKPIWDAPLDDLLWQYYGQCARKVGLEWGGDWTYFAEGPHCQYPKWRIIAGVAS